MNNSEQILLDILRPKGEWIDTGSGQECSVCHEIQYGYDNFRHFCANCGAKMQKGYGMGKISEVLSVAYDNGDEDISCLIVAKQRHDKFTVLNEFRGAEADKLYHELVKQKGGTE